MAEDAMTRERAMEEALKPFARIALARDDEPGSLDMISGPDLAITPKDVRRARAALSSAQQEPARSAEVEEVADDIYAIAWDAYMDAIAATDHRPPSSSGLRAALTAALRRYAGDGGVTDEQTTDWKTLFTQAEEQRHFWRERAETVEADRDTWRRVAEKLEAEKHSNG